jgi:hypothetical protein
MPWRIRCGSRHTIQNWRKVMINWSLQPAPQKDCLFSYFVAFLGGCPVLPSGLSRLSDPGHARPPVGRSDLARLLSHCSDRNQPHGSSLASDDGDGRSARCADGLGVLRWVPPCRRWGSDGKTAAVVTRTNDLVAVRDGRTLAAKLS